ncbi:MAG: FtsX-like permease family protein [Chitinophagaceae bacterium]|nr:FtsX-like permease family protein [Chitinophagaceae bacterium]
MYFTFAWRYFKANKSTNAINIISWVSVAAITIGTAALIIILSVFNGFEGLVKSLYSSFYTDLRIVPVSGKTLTLTHQQIEQIRKSGGINNFSLIAEEKALLQNGDFQTIVFIKGVDSNYAAVAGVDEKMVKGNFALGTAEKPSAVMGVGIENAVGIQADRAILPLTVYLPRKGVKDFSNPLESLSEGLLMPAGSFAIQQEFDNKYVVTNVDFLKEYLGYQPDEYNAAEISLVDASKEKEVKKALQSLLGKNFLVQTRFEQNKTLYTTIVLEKWAIYAIFSLILIVAAFNMIGALTMLVLEKQKDIQVLQAMGAGKTLVKKIFLSEGMLIALIGSAGGIVIALILYYLQTTYKLIPLQGDTFIINYYPIKLVWSDFALVISTVFVIGMLAAWFPSSRAANQVFELRN